MFITSDTARQILDITHALDTGELTTLTIPTSCPECGETDAWELEREHLTYRVGNGPLVSAVIVCCEGFIPVKRVGPGEWIKRAEDGSDA